MTATTPSGRRIRLFVLIDALGWQFLEGREFLSDLLPYRTPVRTVLGFSSGAIPSILTGQPPERTGHWNLFYYDPEGSPFRWLRWLNFLPDRLADNRVSRKIMKELGRRVLGMGPNFECHVSPKLLPWFNFIERRCIYKRGGILGAESIFDRLAKNGTPHRIYTYQQFSDAGTLEQAARDIAESDATFFFLYLSEMDHLLHEHAAGSPELDERLKWYEDKLRKLYELASRIDPRVELAIFSDHGMTPVTEHYDLLGEVETLRLRSPQDYLAVYDSTMARFWLFSDSARERLRKLLEDCPCGRILGDGELKELGVLFPDRRYGELIFLLNPGWLLARSDFNGSSWVPVGMHGYHPDDPYSDAVFLSNRQAPTPLASVCDVYERLREGVA